MDTFARVLIACVVVLGTALFIVGVVWLFRRGTLVMAQLRKHGIRTEGTVARMVRSGGGGWHMKYRYRDNQSGREYAGWGLVDGSQHHWPEVGDPIAVMYLPDRPWVSSLANDLYIA